MARKILLIEDDKDILGAVVPKKELNWQLIAEAAKNGVPFTELQRFSGSFNVNPLKNVEPPKTLMESFEVESVGTGMMLIKKEVFEKLKEVTDSYTYSGHGILGIEQGEKMYQYWKSGITKEGHLSGEDINFCNMWRDLGEKVYAAAWAKTTHIGSYEFSGSAI